MSHKQWPVRVSAFMCALLTESFALLSPVFSPLFHRDSREWLLDRAPAVAVSDGNLPARWCSEFSA
jgi:hypothetical protein